MRAAAAQGAPVKVGNHPSASIGPRPMGAIARLSVSKAPTAIFVMYLVLMAITFLSLPNRVPAVGPLRPTLVLTAMIVVGLLVNARALKGRLSSSPARWLTVLIAYVLISLPLVEWPGSVLKTNLEILVKSISFFFFTVLLVDTKQRLRLLVGTFVACQLIRVIEPLYLNITQGYWGGSTQLENWVMMNRLAGAPWDIVNPNGLAFIILTALPFLHFWAFDGALTRKMLYAMSALACVYALTLTESRSGMVGLLVLLFTFVAFSKRRALALVLVAVGVTYGATQLDGATFERYLSIVSSNAAGASSAQGRIDGVARDLHIALQHPLFGHGLGTSYEANYNATGQPFKSHNLYAEALVELGLIGFCVLMAFLVSVIREAKGLTRLLHAEKTLSRNGAPTDILRWLPKSLAAWIFMCMIFSLASFGLSEYQWYFFAGLVIATERIAALEQQPIPAAAPHRRFASSQPEVR